MVDIPPAMYDLWVPGDHKIAQLELLQVLVGLIFNAARFRRRRGIWFIDNTAALMSLIRGRSDSPDLDRLAELIHATLFALQCWIYFEWVESESNWSDGISRYGFDDVWIRGRNFNLRRGTVPLELWQLPIRAVIRVVDCL